MSYSIVYDKQFIKVGEKYLPIVLAGDSNLYEGYGKREKRVRNFHTFIHERGLQFLYSEENLIKKADDYRLSLMERERSEDYSDNNFGFHTGIAIGGRSTMATTFGHYKGIFKTGCKKALTLEQLNSYRKGFKVSLRSYSSGFFKYANTSDELETILDEALEWERENNKTIYVSISLHYDDLKWLKRQFFPIKKPTTKTLNVGDTYYILKYNDPSSSRNYNYFKKFLKHGFKGSILESMAKKFLNKKHAEKQMEILQSRFPTYNLKIVECFA